MEDKSGFNIEVGRRHIIERPRLTRLLDQATARVLMLVAPAGYGKTTLAQQWLANRRHGWYRATAASADVAALAVGLAEAASAIVPGAAKRLRERLRVTQEPEREVDVLAELLAEDLSDWPADAWLAIDDYQLASSPPSEEFVDTLVGLTPVRLLLTSRRRPPWVTARRILYGEIHEIERSALAMTPDEAAIVLGVREEIPAPGLVALAHGWPAVIGLAALTPGAIPEGEVPIALYDFFAEELYGAASPRLKEGLRQMLLAPKLDEQLAMHLFGSDAEDLLDEATRFGFLTPTPPSEAFEFHPLLRRFLEAKLAPSSKSAWRVTDAMVDFFAQHCQWDSAFSTIEQASRFDLIERLVRSSLDELVSLGRLSTLSSWTEAANAHGVSGPVIDLAAAELSLRRGQYEAAEVAALRAASTLDTADPLRPRCFLIAGQSAHFSDRGADALAHFTHGRSMTRSKADEAQATWGQFVSAIDLERDEALTYLSDYERTAPNEIDTAVRSANGQLLVGIRLRGVRAALPIARRQVDLVAQVTDPMARSAFLSMLAVAFVLAGEYDEALKAADRAADESERYRLDFVLPHILVLKAAAELGRRDFNRARQILRQATTKAQFNADLHVAMNAATVEARLLLALGSYDEALDATSRVWDRVPSKTMYGEYVGCRALVLACSGRANEALDAAKEADAISVQLDARVLTSWARAVVAVRTNDAAQPPKALLTAVRLLETTGHVDGFVAAYRGYPPLLANARPLINGLDFRAMLARAHDQKFLKTVAIGTTTGGFSELTEREREVYALLAKGQSNREIGATLYISEATVKVHVRHILEKLGVRSRTAAVAKNLAHGGGESLRAHT